MKACLQHRIPLKASWRAALGLIFLLALPQAHAQDLHKFCPFQLSRTIDFGSIEVTNATPAIGNQLGTPVTVEITALCDSDSLSNELKYEATHSTNAGGRWTTDVPGVFVKVERLSPTRKVISAENVGTEEGVYDANDDRGFDYLKGTFQVTLYRSAQNIDAGQHTANIFNLISENIYTEKEKTPVPIIFSITSPTCNVDTLSDTNKPINLKPITAGQLAAPGATAGNTNFNLIFDCDPRLYSTNIKITFSDANDPSNSTDILTASGASNVGLRLAWTNGPSNGNPVKFGPGNSVNFGTPIAGKVNMGLQASYIATGSPVGTGQVAAAATFTLDYQ